MHCLKIHVLAAPKEKKQCHACFQLAPNQTMFCSCFELFILVGLQQNMGSHSPIFAGKTFLYWSYIF